MPELPEVETTRRGLAPHCVGVSITRLKVREPRLRWPIPENAPTQVAGRVIETLDRRGKYLLFRLSGDVTMIVHLGMSGSVRVVSDDRPPQRHDHVDIVLSTGQRLRYTDPRRFGSVHVTDKAPEHHPLLARLGPEPLSDQFNTDYLFAQARHRAVAVKALIMDSHIVVGVGNIYATEALFRAGIHPRRAAGRIAKARYERLVVAIREVLGAAIEMGGTTLRDYSGTDGAPGYFQQTLDVYGRAGQPCRRCGRTIRSLRLTQRASAYCPSCQR